MRACTDYRDRDMAKGFVYSYNVGFGNACLYRYNNLAVLIDAGSINYGDADVLKAQQDIINNILEVLSEGGKLLVIITHPHVDHFNFVQAILSPLGNVGSIPDRILVFTGGVLVHLIVERFYEEDGVESITCGQSLLEYLSVQGFQYYSIVPSQEKDQIAQNIAIANPISVKEALQKLKQFCTVDIKLVRVYDDGCKPDNFFSLSRNPNDNTVIVKIKVSYESLLCITFDYYFIFMGDAPSIGIDDDSLKNIMNNIYSVSAGVLSNVLYYQASHHGSDRNGEFRWLGCLRAIIGNFPDNIVFSTLPGYFAGIPNGPSLSEMFNEKFRANTKRKFTAASNIDSKNVIRYNCDDSNFPYLFSTFDHSSLISGSSATGICCNFDF